jgi:hypothetical protein
MLEIATQNCGGINNCHCLEKDADQAVEFTFGQSSSHD